MPRVISCRRHINYNCLLRSLRSRSSILFLRITVMFQPHASTFTATSKTERTRALWDRATFLESNQIWFSFFFSNKLELELVWAESFVPFLQSNWKMFSPLRILFSIYVPPLSPMIFRRVRHNLVVPSAWNCSVLREKETNSFSRCSKEHNFLLLRFRNERNTR